MNTSSAKPFLRWAGGKRWLASELKDPIKETLTGKYIEPFLGSGAVFFSVCPTKALLSDLNSDLICAYQQTIEAPEKLIRAIKKLPVNKSAYLKIRASKPRGLLQRAVRMIYLNRTCYGGIYRENRRGEFNTPFGGGSRTPEPLWKDRLIESAHMALAKPTIFVREMDFEFALESAAAGDVIYCDPPYHAVTKNQFNRYGARVFDWADQIRLAMACRKAAAKGAVVIISNSHCKEIRKLYPNSYLIFLRNTKCIGNRPSFAGAHNEYLIVLDPFENFHLWRNIGSLRQNFQSISYEKIIKQLTVLHEKAMQVSITRAHSRVRSKSVS